MDKGPKTDCIFFQKVHECDGYHQCVRTGVICKADTMCEHCRMWDAYIPRNASEAEREKAERWQDMPFGEQPDYEEYFGRP